MAGFKLNADKFYTEIMPQILFLYSIFIDSVNGALQEFMDLHLPIGVLFRGVIMLLLFSKGFYIKGNKFNAFFRVMVLIYILAMLVWTITAEFFSLSMEFGVLFRIIYFFVVVFYFYNYRDKFNKVRLVRLVVFAAVIIACLNVFCFITDTGIKSYDDEFGFGTKAFYADGNSLGLYMVLSLCLSIWYAYYSRNALFGLAAVIITIGTMLIGTRAALFGLSAAWIIFPISFVFFKDGIIKTVLWKKITVLVAIAVVTVFAVIPAFSFIINFDGFTSSRFTGESIVSPREVLINNGKAIINGYQGMEIVIGNGTSGGLSALGKADYYGKFKSIESDFYDQVLAYGWILGSLMIMLNLVLLLQYVRPVFRRFNSVTFVVAAVGCVWILAAYMAGHGFYNTMLAPVFGVLIVIVSNNGYDFRKTER